MAGTPGGIGGRDRREYEGVAAQASGRDAVVQRRAAPLSVAAGHTLISTQRSTLTCARRCACPMRQTCSRGGLRPLTAPSGGREGQEIQNRYARWCALRG